jgi:hypothetical protein
MCAALSITTEDYVRRPCRISPGSLLVDRGIELRSRQPLPRLDSSLDKVCGDFAEPALAPVMIGTG